METFAQRLKKALLEKKLSQKELAAAAKVTEAAISGYLAGTYLPRDGTLLRIAAALGVDKQELLPPNQFVKPLENSQVRKTKLPVLEIEVK